MTHEELTELLDRTETENNNGNYLQAEERCNEALDVIAGISVADAGILVLKARSLRLLSESYARRWRSIEALKICEEALAVAIESKSAVEEAKAIATLGYIYNKLNDYDRALELCNAALKMFQQQGDALSEARVWVILGTVYTFLGIYNLALENLAQALAIYESLGDRFGITAATANIGNIYSLLSDNERALEYYNRALAGYQELGNRAGVATMLCNIGNMHSGKKDYSLALEFYRKALAIFEELDAQGFIAITLNNIAWIYNTSLEYVAALETYNRVLAIREAIGDKLGAADQIANIGELYGNQKFEGYDAVKAEEYLLKGLSMAVEIGAKHSLGGTYKMVADFYKAEKRWEEFAVHFEKYHDLEKEVMNEETQKAAALTEQRRQAAEREKILAAERARAQATEELLHKTLPKSIADRVIRGETRIADHFESASILFADVVGFTKISSAMPPSVVLGFMNFIFEHFDALAAKHGCERIKTIGDGYMAVCGAPVRYDNHAERLALMALEMMEDIILPEEIRENLPKGTLFHLRIGLHCGEITAGLIGTGKLAYDIYGDAVNTSSRMESHGEAGKIHCSEEFIRELKVNSEKLKVGKEGQQLITINSSLITAFPRGEMEIKGKGMMRTYFLEKL